MTMHGWSRGWGSWLGLVLSVGWLGAVPPAEAAEATGVRPTHPVAAPVSPITQEDPNGLLAPARPDPSAMGLTVETAPPPPPRPPSAEAMATKSVEVTPAHCRALVAHRPRDDVAYKGGVDVHGRPVVPADLEDRSAWTAGIAESFTMPLAINPYARQDREAPGGLQDPAVSLGTLRIDVGSGRMTLDGRPLTDPQAAALSDACHARGW